jgi:hypothetical protein
MGRCGLRVLCSESEPLTPPSPRWGEGVERRVSYSRDSCSRPAQAAPPSGRPSSTSTKTPSVALRPSPQWGEGQDERVLTLSVVSESEPPHPSLSPLGRGSRTPHIILTRQGFQVGANDAAVRPAARLAAPRRASSAGSSMTWCIGTPGACQDKRSDAPFVPSAHPHGSRTE